MLVGLSSRKGAVRFALLVSSIVLLLIVGAGMRGNAVSASVEKRANSPKVVCITSFDPPRGRYQYKPDKCTLHKRGEFPIAGYNTSHIRRMNWKSWDNQSATGKGELFITTYGPAPATVRLTERRSPCGTEVFTQARIDYRTRYNGENHRDHFRFKLDDCLT